MSNHNLLPGCAFRALENAATESCYYCKFIYFPVCSFYEVIIGVLIAVKSVKMMADMVYEYLTMLDRYC